MDDGSSETCLDWLNNTNFKNIVWFIKANNNDNDNDNDNDNNNIIYLGSPLPSWRFSVGPCK